MHDLNQSGDELAWKFEFQMYMSLPTFLAFRNPVLNFLNFLNSRVLLSYKPLSYKKHVYQQWGSGSSCEKKDNPNAIWTWVGLFDAD